MMILNNPLTPNDFNDKEQPFEIGFEPAADSERLLADITLFLSIIKSCYEAVDKRTKKLQIQRLLDAKDWVEHYRDKETGRRILSESQIIEHKHELKTAILLTKANYDVVFAPKGMFKRSEKKFDIFLLRDTVFFSAELKYIHSKLSRTIEKRIKEGSHQTNRVIVDIRSDIGKKYLIDGLRSEIVNNKLVKEILLLYKKKFYRLPKNLILSEDIYSIVK